MGSAKEEAEEQLEEGRWFHPSRNYYENREKDVTLSWRRWLRDRYARYWYLLGSLAVDLIVPGTILQFDTGAPPEAWEIALATVVAIVLVYLEYRGYRKFWPTAALE